MKKKEKEIEEFEKECSCNCNKECECTCEHDCDCDCKCDNDKDLPRNEEELLLLKNTIENLNLKVKQTQAELINYRKRKDEEVTQLMKFANKDLILEILPILDNFERALNMKSDSTEFEKYSEGYKILYSHLVDTLKKFGVEEIPALGEEFNPELHEAVMIGALDDHKNDEIIEVFNKGYLLKGRVIRASKVKVNKID